jgi:xanthine/uracil/vitamin C permease (AzgA family)
MAVMTEGLRNADWLVWEEDAGYSRDKITIAASQEIVKGQVLGIVTATSQYAAFDPAGTLVGTDAAAGVALDDYKTGLGQTVSGVAIRREALVIAKNLVFLEGTTAGEKAAAVAELKAIGILTREQS